MTEPVWTYPDLAEPDVLLLAEVFALAIRPGDLIGLRGDLGAGKSTFARALIRALMRERLADGDPAFDDIPSPTFTLAQDYRDLRVPIMHFDLYRLSAAEEIHELGLDLALSEGAALIEWPENAADELPEMTFSIVFLDGQASGAAHGASPGNVDDLRAIRIASSNDASSRLARLTAAFKLLRSGDVLLSASGRPDAPAASEAPPRVTHLYGDASARSYAQITPRGVDAAHERPTSALLMDWPAQPDGPPVRHGLPYSRIAHIAEDMRAFLAVGDALRAGGFAVPAIHSMDMDAGYMVLEDFGPRVFGSLISEGEALLPLWSQAIDVLAALREVPPPSVLTSQHFDGELPLPVYDRDALTIEVELLLDWYWPFAHGSPAPNDERASFLAAWQRPFDLIAAQPLHWVLRDFHSPNLIDRPNQNGLKRTGLIDFQDAVRGPAAYDVVSLIQDARLDVDPAFEPILLQRYLSQVRDSSFDEEGFMASYAVMGAQRATKILGIFARLSMRDQKPQYLAHLPRVWCYLQRNLSASEDAEKTGLSELADWFHRTFPPGARPERPPTTPGGLDHNRRSGSQPL
ncbi:MAG: tRNA (adenosine(37)-N6)-threonylcarbamoyltransferase complex ATPase subunit type 1 TsaE [Pseudomonadota bacterium]